jgi:phosphoribosyl 1,2-cyclic phosphodiesterase
MGLRLCVLGSGSSGNCTYVASPTTAVLIDAGLSARAVAARLARIGVSLDEIQGICVSHEHSDHVAGLSVLHRQHGIPLYANRGTIQGLRDRRDLGEMRWEVFPTGPVFAIGDLAISAFAVRHDTEEPVGFVVADRTAAIGVATDLGEPTAAVREQLRQCHAVVLEANHDEEMLLASRRPAWLKERILGPDGHLSNASAAAMLAEIANPRLRRVFLAHLSAECNTPERACRAARATLERAGHHHVELSLTHPDRISQIWDGRELR